jgi:hypothetical protein
MHGRRLDSVLLILNDCKGEKMGIPKKTALCGIFAGFSLAMMILISLFPSMDLALPAVAGLVILFMVIELGKGWAFCVYCVVSVLSVLLLGNKFAALLYAAFFGIYPILKSIFESKLRKVLEIICKLASFNLMIVGCYLIGSKFFGVTLDAFGGLFAQYTPWIMLAIGNLTFFFYDYTLNQCIRLYKQKLQKKFFRFFPR